MPTPLPAAQRVPAAPPRFSWKRVFRLLCLFFIVLAVIILVIKFFLQFD